LIAVKNSVIIITYAKLLNGTLQLIEYQCNYVYISFHKMTWITLQQRVQLGQDIEMQNALSRNRQSLPGISMNTLNMKTFVQTQVMLE
jgi:hypothetical protein